MCKKLPNIDYNFTVQNISDDDNPAYKAYIPAFRAIVYGDTIQELLEGIDFTIETEIDAYRKEGKPVPCPDRDRSYSGKLMLRIEPTTHNRLALQAEAKGQSLNRLISDYLEQCCA